MLSALAQLIALTDVMLSAAAASARHQYMLLALALVLNCTGWCSTLTRCLAKGQLIAPAGVTLAVTAASACLCVRHRGCVGVALIHAAALAHILGGAG